MKRTKFVPWGGKKGSKGSDAVVVQSSSGKDVVLLNPSQRAGKYAQELKSDKKFTNGNVLKGDGAPLTKEERAYRAGYLQRSQDGQDAYNAIHHPATHLENKKNRAAKRKNRG